MADEGAPSRHPTIEERETLMKPFTPKRTGFAPRSIQQLTKRRPPHSTLNIECNHLLRCSTDETAHGHHPMMYTMWKEAGKHPPPYPARADFAKPDSNYNSNVWRNFRKSYGFHVDTKDQNISEMIAQLYPLNIPPPSKVGDYSYPRFLTETPLIKDGKMRKLAIDRTTQDILEFKRIRLKSEMRNPPLDESGDIVPPINFKKYAHRFAPPENNPDESARGETRVDIFGKQVPVLKNKNKEPFMWKMSYRLNNPQYEKVQTELDRRRQITPQHPPAAAGMSVRGRVH